MKTYVRSRNKVVAVPLLLDHVRRPALVWGDHRVVGDGITDGVLLRRRHAAGADGRHGVVGYRRVAAVVGDFLEGAVSGGSSDCQEGESCPEKGRDKFLDGSHSEWVSV